MEIRQKNVATKKGGPRTAFYCRYHSPYGNGLHSPCFWNRTSCISQNFP